jgi:hypothetical protein
MRSITVIIICLCVAAPVGSAQTFEMKTAGHVVQGTEAKNSVYEIDTSILNHTARVYALPSNYLIKTNGAIKESKNSSGKTVLEIVPPPANNTEPSMSPQQTAYCRLQGTSHQTYCSGGGCKYPTACTHIKDAHNDYCTCKIPRR